MRRKQSSNSKHRRWTIAAGLSLLAVLCGIRAPAQAPPSGKDDPTTTASQQTPRHHWKVDDFDADLEQVDGKRSFEQGRTVLEEALCTVCHRVGDHGGDLGPDLSKPEKPRSRRELLREILEPSRDIEPRYRTYVVATADGHVISGMMVEQTDQQVTIRARPIGVDASHTIPRTNIESIEQLDISMMPDELLSRLSREEVLDLLAYVEAKGDPKSPLFRRP